MNGKYLSILISENIRELIDMNILLMNANV